MLQVRDYMYLDTVKLEHYLSSLDAGVIAELRSTTRQEEQETAGLQRELDIAPTGGSDSVKESTLEKVMRISDFHSFARLYEHLHGQLMTVDEYSPIDIAKFRKGAIVEVSRGFEKSPVNEMLDSLFQLSDLMQNFGVPGADDPEIARTLHAMALLFRGQSENDRTLPMVANAEEAADSSLLFVVQNRFVVSALDEFEGEMTVLGRVSKVIPVGTTVSMLELLTVLPRVLRRSKDGASNVRAAIINLFKMWPDELGGPISDDSLVLEGPALMVEPLAVYR